MIDSRYRKITEAAIRPLVLDDDRVARVGATVQGELDRVSLTLTRRIRQLAERYGGTLPQITDEVAALAARVEKHPERMGVPCSVAQA